MSVRPLCSPRGRGKCTCDPPPRHPDGRRGGSASHGGGFADFGQEFVVVLELLQTIDQQFQTRSRISVGRQARENSTQLPDHLQLLAVEEQFLVTGAGTIDVDGRIDALFGQTTVEAKFHVARSLELFEDRFVHAAVRLDETRGEDRQAAALFHVAGRTEELLRRVQRAGIDTTQRLFVPNRFPNAVADAESAC